MKPSNFYKCIYKIRVIKRELYQKKTNEGKILVQENILLFFAIHETIENFKYKQNINP